LSASPGEPVLRVRLPLACGGLGRLRRQRRGAGGRRSPATWTG